MKDSVISVQGFRKVYGSFTAVDGITFSVERGQIFGLLGPNGAGKTSTLECLEGIRKADGGSLEVLGVDPNREPRRLSSLIGVQLQTSALPPTMTSREAVKFFCAYHGVPPRYDLLEHLGLEGKINAQYSQLSTGQQRRLSLVLAIAHKPPVLILDEPTAGLDVGSRATLHSLMAELKAQGTSILLATHDMAEAEKMADWVAILLNGKIVAAGTPREITAAGSGLTRVSVRTEESLLHNSNIDFPAVQQWIIKGEYAVYYSTDPGPTVSALLEFIKNNQDRLVDLRVERPNLEERFLEITAPGEPS
ncbi:MAG: ABC transporter ATP-binding protein [Anaerolineales bacterium]